MSISRLSWLMTCLFLTLKLTGATEWSWGYTLLPFAVFVGVCIREVELEKALGYDSLSDQ